MNPKTSFFLFFMLALILVTGSFAQIYPLSSPNPVEDSDYGYSSATDGQTLVVGAPAENSNAGAVYISEYNGLEWVYVAPLEPNSVNPASEDFGYSVDVDGDTIVVGAQGYNSNQGAIYIFEKDPVNGWDVDPIRVVVSGGQADDYFGRSVAIDGDTIVSGAYGVDDEKGAAYVYEYIDGNWDFTIKIYDPNGLPRGNEANGAWFGYSVGIDGDAIVVGAKYDYDNETLNWRRGSACAFRRVGGVWDQSGMVKLIPSQWQEIGCSGSAVAISGNLVAVGNPKTDNGALGDGSVSLFRWNGSGWDEEETLYSPGPDDSYYFGDAVSLDGNRLIVGDYRATHSGSSSGSAFLFEWDGYEWSESTELITGGVGDRVGKSVAICGDVVFVGAYTFDDGEVQDAGMVYEITLPAKRFNAFRVNFITVNQQKDMAIASRQNGEFIVVWESKYSTENPWYEIACQRYNRYGIRIGQEFTINQQTDNAQDTPVLAMRPDGGFVAAWESYNTAECADDVYARIYDSNCLPVTNEFKVHTHESSFSQRNASVAVNDAGDFMIVWGSFHDVYDPVRYWEARGRIYNSNGTPKTGDFRVTADYDGASEPIVVANSNGNFIVLAADDARDIQAYEYNSNGTLIGSPHFLVDMNAAFEYQAHVDPIKGHLVLLYGNKPSDQSMNVCVKKFNASYNEILAETNLNEPSNHDSGLGAVAQLSNGDYVVTWTRKDRVNDYDDFIVRRFSSDFVPLGDEQILNSQPSPFPYYIYGGNQSVITAIDPNQYVVAWSMNMGDDDMDIMAAIGPKTYLGDFDFDQRVNLSDFQILAEGWLNDEPVLDIAPEGGDGIVNLLDFSAFAGQFF